MGRLRRLEAVVTELTGQMEDGATESTTSAPRQDASTLWQKHNDPTEDFGHLVTDADGSLRVAKGFWSIFCTEVDNIFQAVADVADATEEHPHATDDDYNVEESVRASHQSFVFGGASASGNVDLSPLPSQMLFIWQVFCENVDPFIKVLDTEATERSIRQVKSKLQTLDSEMEALTFAVSLAAVVSLDEPEVELNFGIPKPRLLARLRVGTERALSKAEFMTTKSLAVVQAFVIYITVLPLLGASQLAGPMTAILVRVVLAMGLHRDPAAGSQKQSKLHTETQPMDLIEARRRLWWHVCFLDARVRRKDVPELSISPSTASTKEPSRPSESLGEPGFTNVTPCLIRCELWRLSHSLRSNAKDSFSTQQQRLTDARTHIYQTYYLDCDISDEGLQSFTYYLTQLLFSQIEYAICRRQSNDANQEEKGLSAATALMETTFTLTTRTSWKGWVWQLQGHAPWSAMLFVLGALSRRTWTSREDRAWAALERVADMLSEETRNLRVSEVVKRKMQQIRESKQLRPPEISETSDDTPLTSDQDYSRGCPLPNQSQFVLPGTESASDFVQGCSTTLLPPLQESWDLPYVGTDCLSEWEPVLDTIDAMDWQEFDGSFDISSFGGLNAF